MSDTNGQYAHKFKKKQCLSKVSLQARPACAAIDVSLTSRHASFFALEEGSLTLEAALLTPIWLCAVCTLILMAQMLIAQVSVQYSVSKSADLCASRFAVTHISDNEDTSLMATAGLIAAFEESYNKNAACTHCILGGKAGVVAAASTYDDEKEQLTIRADYILKCPLPFFNFLKFYKTAQVSRRVYSGYLPHGDEKDAADDMVVYVTPNQSVYHLKIECTHLTRHIKQDKEKGTLVDSGVRPCEICCKDGLPQGTVYLTEYGEAYHSSLSCSGLKRSIRMVHLSDVKGLPLCSRCSEKYGGSSGN